MRRLAASIILAVGACQEPAARRADITEPSIESPIESPLGPPGITNIDFAALMRVDPWAPRDTGPGFGAPEPADPDGADPGRVTVEPAQTIVGAAGGVAEPIAQPGSGDVITAMHSTTISALALTDDGTVAATSDARRSVRLWPTLDGTREPVVLTMRSPATLAITRAGDEVVIAGLDDAGQLELLRTTANGESLRRVFVETGRPLVAIHATRHGILALREDRAIVAVTLEGTGLGTLVADPGEHITSIAVRRDHVLAMLETGTEVRGRWIDMTAGVRWGTRTRALPVGPGPVALSPDGSRLAGVARSGMSVPIVDLATGRVIVRPYKDSFDDPKLRPVGFLANDVLAIASSGERLTWWGRAAGQDDFELATGEIRVGDKRLIGNSSGALALTGSVDEAIYYLGYRMGSIDTLLPSATAVLATDTRSIVELDTSLHTRAVHELPTDDASRSWHGVMLVDRTHVIAHSYARGGSGLYLVDLATRKATLIERDASALGYEPSTRLLAFQTATSIELAVFDPRTGTFSESTTLPVELRNSPRARPLDPAKARGNVLAFATTTSPDVIKLTLVKSFDPARAVPIELGASRDVRVDESFWEVNGDSLSLLDRLLPQHTRIASKDRALTAELHDQRITLRDKAGIEKWTVPSAGATGVVWTPEGTLLAYGPGIARLDLESGALADRRCGWRFGRWTVHPGSFGGTTLCEAPAHF